MLDWLFQKKQNEEKKRAQQKAQGGDASVQKQTPEKGGEEEKQEVKIRTEGPKPALPVDEYEEKICEKYEDTMGDCESVLAESGFDLPMLPASAMKVMQLLQDPEVPSRKISDTVMTDQVLTAKFLRMANSPMYGGVVRIDSVHQAVARMGLATVKNVVLTISLSTTILREKRLGETAKKLWEHSIASAVAAQTMAVKSKAPPATAYLAGLMHDIGKIPAFLILRLCIGDGKAPSNRMVETLLEKHHVRAGIALLTHWELPIEACLAVTAHHAVNSLEEAAAQAKLHCSEADADEIKILSRMLGSVVLADRALTAIGIADEPGNVQIIGSQLAQDLGVEEETAEKILKDLPEILEQAAQ